jgi:hypothetical protein
MNRYCTVYGLQLYKNQDLLTFNATGIILDSDSSGSSSDDETASHTERSDRSDADKKVRATYCCAAYKTSRLPSHD